MNRIKTLLADSESLILFGIIIAATIIIATIVGKNLQHKLREKATEQNADITSFLFIKHVLTATIYLFGFGWALLTLPISATFAHSLFAGAGASTLNLGFASQQVLSNVMRGMFLIIKTPFKIIDIVEIQGNWGKVNELNLHDTIIEDEENLIFEKRVKANKPEMTFVFEIDSIPSKLAIDPRHLLIDRVYDDNIKLVVETIPNKK